MKRGEVFDDALFDTMVEQGYIRVRKHPEHDLYIANYSETAAYEKVWNPATTACRGLIYTGDGTIVARPFRKFFNVGENGGPTLPDLLRDAGEPVRVYEKSDGSMGVLFWVDGDPHIATRGSFASDQAIWATNFIRTQPIPEAMRDTTRTYLFEILYPANRIVVDYGGKEGLVCLAAIDIETGRTIDGAHLDWHDPIEEWSDRVHGWDGGAEDFLAIERPNHEGYVLHFPATDERVKAKHTEYVYLHRIITGTTARTVWEFLSEGKPLDDLLRAVPEEFADWVRATGEGLQAQVDAYLTDWDAAYRAILDDLAADGWQEGDLRTGKPRGIFARKAKDTINQYAMFTLLDGNSAEPIAWKLCRPEATKPFVADVETGETE